ncbi:unnamed protein product [Bemisia tabaci]|uniref:Uncharacterized protein n=1 Tax=Bemisia tabaci TaxID=7038 RepID=A0A9P0AJ34_BEMTA|nr:unnamed protein product [Bemisia tabaci]
MGSIPLVASFSDSRNIGTCILIALSLVLAYKCFVDFEEQKQIPLVLSCLLLVLPFLPAANILVTVGFVIAERVLYIPSSGFVLLVAYGVQLMCSRATHKQKSLICSVIILVLCCFAAKTHIRNKDWASRETLSRRMNRTTEAMAMLERCLSLNSEYTPAYLLLAKLHAGPIAGRLLRHVALLAPHSPDHAAYYAAWLAKHSEYL